MAAPLRVAEDTPPENTFHNVDNVDKQQKSWFDGISDGSVKALDTVSTFSNQMKKMRGLNLRFVSLEQTIRELTFYPLTGLTLDDILEKRGWTDVYKNSIEWRSNVTDCCGGSEVQMRTADGRQISALWCPRAHDAALKEREFQYLTSPEFLTSAGRTPERLGLSSQSSHGFKQRVELPAESAVILFHANAMVSLDMVSHILWYRSRGMHVLALTLGGYPGSEGQPSEITSYMDAECALKWLLVRCPTLSAKRIVLHGLSLGGALAAGLASNYPQLHLTLDQTFVNATEVAQIVAKLAFDNIIPSQMVASVVNTAFPKGVTSSQIMQLSNTNAADASSNPQELLSSFASSLFAPKKPPSHSFGHPTSSQSDSDLNPSNAVSSFSSIPSNSHNSSQIHRQKRFEKKTAMLNIESSRNQANWESEFISDSYSTEDKLFEIGNLENEHLKKYDHGFSLQDPVGQLYVFSSNEDVMMPREFADRLLEARYHHYLNVRDHSTTTQPLDNDDDQNDLMGEKESTVSDFNEKNSVKSKHIRASMKQEELFDEEGNKVRTFAEIQAWNKIKTSHFSLIKGGHGTFFGDQMGASNGYQMYLENTLGLIASRRNYTLAIQEARNIVYAKQEYKDHMFSVQ